MLRMVLDLETRSDVSVVDVGPHKYAAHPSNEILCFGWQVNDGSPAKVAVAVGGSDGRAAVERRVRDAGRVVATLQDFIADWERSNVLVAHNSEFEVVHFDRHFPELKARERHWSCTASRARRLGLPGSLADACRVLNTPHQKSEAGHSVMLQVSQPRPVWRTNPLLPKFFDDADRLAKTAIYCVDDILAEADLDAYLPELPAQERLYWEQTTRCNHRGIRLDHALLDAMDHVIRTSGSNVAEDVRRATGIDDFALTNVEAIKSFCAERGVFLDDLRAATVEAKLGAHRSGVRKLPESVVTVLSARQESGGKSSNAKLATMRARMMDDGYTRDTTMYHGAHTGRTTGSGINVLNLPRPYKGFDQDVVVKNLLAGDLDAIRREQKVSPAVAVSAAIRGLIVPSEGKRFVIGDYSSVEPCCLFTLARQWDAVEVLRNKGNLYIEFGKSFYGRTLDKARDVAAYTLMKGVILGCGYGLGADNFVAKLQAEGSDLPEVDIRRAHAAYRERYPEVPRLWNGIGEAMKQAIRSPGRTFAYNDVPFYSDGYWLVVTLPSGRALHYPNARLQPGKYSDEVVYEGWMRIDNRPAGWGDVRTWGARTCVSGETLVLTENGWKRLRVVRQTDRVWDGKEWVSHSGLWFKGIKSTVRLDGVSMTPDHQVLTSEGWIDAGGSEGYHREEVQLPDGSFLRGIGRQTRIVDCALRLWDDFDGGGAFVTPRAAEVVRMYDKSFDRQGDRDARDDQASSVLGLALHERSMSASVASSLGKLRRAWGSRLRAVADFIREFLGGYGADVSARAYVGQTGQQRRIRPEKLSMGVVQSPKQQSTQRSKDRHSLGADVRFGRSEEVGNRSHDSTVSPVYRSDRPRPFVLRPGRVEAVYDLADCGPLNRFVVLGEDGPFFVHNCENLAQAICRDVMAEDELEVEALPGWAMTMTVYDELVAECPDELPPGEGLKMVLSIMSQSPRSFPAMPVRAEGFEATRYSKG